MTAERFKCGFSQGPLCLTESDAAKPGDGALVLAAGGCASVWTSQVPLNHKERREQR